LAQAVPTVSEHANEAFLHTDSQYRAAPENVFALLCLRPAECDGGLSLLMTYQDLMDELAKLPDGAAQKETLKEVPFPFAVPSAFKQNPDGPEEFVFSPILEGENHLRFRVDTMEASLRVHGHSLPDRALRAFDALKTILSTSDKVAKFFLESGDLFFLNNRNTLHGRTAFTDKRRHLLRIRLKTDVA
jgi:alpha-ketoglutarate-dependent taurine dioxygenase